MRFTFKSAALGAATAVLATAFATAALADGMPKRGSIKSAEPPPAPRACSLSANVALTTDYVFRGISQTAEEPALQGGFDLACGIFYAGVFGSNLEFGPTEATMELTGYAGIKPKTGPITWDIGVIYYTYPGAFDPGAEANFLEFKLGGSAEVWKDGTFGVTGFYSPEYTGESGRVWTLEAAFAQALPKVGMFSPTFSALYGYQSGNSSAAYAIIANDDHYSYWNAGVSFGFLEKWSVDFRYWDTDISGAGFCSGAIFQCDQRFVATLKFAY